jgi:hypothetical protein
MIHNEASNIGMDGPCTTELQSLFLNSYLNIKEIISPHQNGVA